MDLDDECEEVCEERWVEDISFSVLEDETDRVIRTRSGLSIVIVGMDWLGCSCGNSVDLFSWVFESLVRVN